MDMMCPWIAFDEVVSFRDSIFSAIGVSNVRHGHHAAAGLIEVLSSHQDIQDGLCGYVRYGCTAHVLDPNYALSESCSDLGSLALVCGRPGIVRPCQGYVTACEAEDYGYLSVPPNVSAMHLLRGCPAPLEELICQPLEELIC